MNTSPARGLLIRNSTRGEPAAGRSKHPGTGIDFFVAVGQNGAPQLGRHAALRLRFCQVTEISIERR